MVPLAAGALLLTGLATSLHAAEEILSYDSVVVVRSGGVLDVTETVRVRAEGDEIRRGI
jgi:hypothetical protein